MPCHTVKLPNGTAIICSRESKARHRCRVCGGPVAFLCDFRSPSRKSGTCDAGLCRRHAVPFGAGLHRCPTHRQEELAL